MRQSLSDFTLYLTEDCNLECAYCFQERRRRSLGFPVIRRALELFGPSFRKDAYLGFYGGEPLLEFATIRRTVDWVEHRPGPKAKSLRYSISTNGTLLNDGRLRFLSAHRFKVNLSHDGTAQDVTRPSRLNSFLLEIIDRLKRLPGIEFETNSVFIPGTAGEIFRSARFFIDRGVDNCHLTHSVVDLWDSLHLGRMREELRELRAFLLFFYRRHGRVPVTNFRSPPSPGLFGCAAGQDRMALAVDGRLWGCRFFADYYGGHENRPGFHSYCFGDIQSFSLNEEDAYPAVCENYRALRMDRFASERKACRRCPSMLFCSTCPATAALSTGVIGKIPAWMCEVKNIWLQETRKFWAEAGKI